MLPYNPMNITQTPDDQEVLMNWTPDGRLLQYRVSSDSASYILYIYDGEQIFATDYGNNLNRYWNEDGWYVSSDEDNMSNPMWNIWAGGGWHLRFDKDNKAITSWYIWNGQERIDLELPLLSSESAWQTFRWTPDDHLFITIGYREYEYMQPIGPTDIFYWNGNTVQEVERPSADETFILGNWSADGRLTLYTSQGFREHWYIWDGVSFTADGFPDTSMLKHINNSAERIDGIQWMPDGRLAIVANGDPESDSLLGHPFSCSDPCVSQVFIWDQETLIQVTDNEFNGFLIDVHDSAYIAVSDFDGLRIGDVTVFDSNQQPVFHSDAAKPHSLSRWSADGNLAYCKWGNLHVWNGQDSIQLTSKTDTNSKWLVAQSRAMSCSIG